MHYLILGCKETTGLAARRWWPRPYEFCYFVIHVVAWSLADLAGRASPGLDEVATALSFRQPGARR